ncbi:hypothetical protein GGR56DRAFT_625757 [Xylariaceae sp. FL0804]|nr:hypothetical protein GGR56DRAFT_625757 [Xylariaceae sp. FL0804]
MDTTGGFDDDDLSLQLDDLDTSMSTAPPRQTPKSTGDDALIGDSSELSMPAGSFGPDGALRPRHSSTDSPVPVDGPSTHGDRAAGPLTVSSLLSAAPEVDSWMNLPPVQYPLTFDPGMSAAPKINSGLNHPWTQHPSMFDSPPVPLGKDFPPILDSPSKDHGASAVPMADHERNTRQYVYKPNNDFSAFNLGIPDPSMANTSLTSSSTSHPPPADPSATRSSQKQKGQHEQNGQNGPYELPGPPAEESRSWSYVLLEAPERGPEKTTTYQIYGRVDNDMQYNGLLDEISSGGKPALFFLVGH